MSKNCFRGWPNSQRSVQVEVRETRVHENLLRKRHDFRLPASNLAAASGRAEHFTDVLQSWITNVKWITTELAVTFFLLFADSMLFRGRYDAFTGNRLNPISTGKRTESPFVASLLSSISRCAQTKRQRLKRELVLSYKLHSLSTRKR